MIFGLKMASISNAAKHSTKSTNFQLLAARMSYEFRRTSTGRSHAFGSFLHPSLRYMSSDTPTFVQDTKDSEDGDLVLRSSEDGQFTLHSADDSLVSESDVDLPGLEETDRVLSLEDDIKGKAKTGFADTKIEFESVREDVRSEAEQLKAASEAVENKYKSMLNEARMEAEDAKDATERAKLEAEEFMAAWSERESRLVYRINEAESKVNAVKENASRLLDSLKKAKAEANAVKEDASRLLDFLKEAEAEVIAAKEDAESVKMEIAVVKDSLLDKEIELQDEGFPEGEEWIMDIPESVLP